MNKEVKNLSSTIEELRLQVIAATSMTYDLAESGYENEKAIAQMEKTSTVWNLFLKEWEELKDEIKKSKDKTMKSEEFENRTIDKGSEFSRLTNIIKKQR